MYAFYFPKVISSVVGVGPDSPVSFIKNSGLLGQYPRDA